MTRPRQRSPRAASRARHDEAAPAKVNLFLHVLGRREDGYHLLESLVAFADIGDRLEVEVAPADSPVNAGESLTVTGPFADALHAELAAGRRLSVETACAIAQAAAAPRRFEAHFTLEKNLPVAAGLGGGTSDGAAALRALARAFDLDWSTEQLVREAGKLGADGPVCAVRRPAMMKGIGETVEPLAAWPAFDAVLVNPGTPVSTPAVFRERAASGAPFSSPIARPPSTRDKSEALAYLTQTCNDLFAAAVAVESSVAAAHDLLQRQGGARLVRLSGSGASCWAIFDDAEAAARAADEIGRAKPGWWVAATRLRGTDD